ncbi:Proliferating cell nuclear antigen [Melia azedarach]|uniref:Proliferating cell nuclear antigen n=1 Tax=Melia azedarach TaxID=155640 RepID=A0ACC1YVC2_MELAZ|nr:Proliferating cell nuclear antigen [Melia azedarach]
MLELKVSNGDLLRRAVAPLIELIDIDDDKGIVIYSPNGVSLTSWDQEGYMYAMLIIKPVISDDNLFRCNSNGCAGIDLNEVYNKLILQYGESSVTVQADDEEHGIIRFIFNLVDEEGNTVSRYETLELKEADNVYDDPETYLERQYLAIIGIPSNDFVEILRYLREDSNDEAILNITNGQVRFSTETNRNIIRRTERDECIMGGVGEEDEFEVKIDLPPLDALQKAALVSTMVWMLYSDEAPLVLNYPVDDIGSLVFYFD